MSDTKNKQQQYSPVEAYPAGLLPDISAFPSPNRSPAADSRPGSPPDLVRFLLEIRLRAHPGARR
ncbi:MAG: hypothetical protein R6V85_09575, partial [Polyangia bacterium]